MKKLVFAAIAASVLSPAAAKVVPSGMITDHAVLQQNSDATLWGKATPGATVTATTSWNSDKVTAKADKDGKWSLEVKTPAATFEPQTITLSDGEPTTISDVLIGEVWLASGQSNMQMPLMGYGGCCLKDGWNEIAAAGNWADKVRFITVPLTQSYEPKDDIEASWTLPSPETAPEYSAAAWWFAKRLANVLSVPVGIVSAAYGGAKVESWTSRELLETYPDVSLDPKDIEPMVHYYRPMLMYNAMFLPIKDYTYKGIIWYQGCSNVSTYETYGERLANMVKLWRDQIGQGDIPFYQVEIAPYDYDNPLETGKAAYLREAQWKAADVIPNYGVIGTNDLVETYERHNIHPGNKEDVGNRLGDLALNRTYGRKQFRCDPPRYKSHRIDGNTVRVAIDAPIDGVCRNCDIVGFEIAGADKVYHAVENPAFDWQTNEVILTCPEVKEPVAVRYCFGDFMPGTMYGGNYLPLVPFRTE